MLPLTTISERKENKTRMGKKILLIDDDPLVLRSFTKLLDNEGYEVIPVPSYEQAVEAIGKKGFDLVLSDIRMPGKSGVETVSDIQNHLLKSGKKDLPIIFITGFANLSAELNANFFGEVLYKPVDKDRLLIAIRDYL